MDDKILLDIICKMKQMNIERQMINIDNVALIIEINDVTKKINISII